jgi:hypothetical protein
MYLVSDGIAIDFLHSKKRAIFCVLAKPLGEIAAFRLFAYIGEQRVVKCLTERLMLLNE